MKPAKQQQPKTGKKRPLRPSPRPPLKTYPTVEESLTGNLSGPDEG